MDTKNKLALIKRNTEEILSAADLKSLIESKTQLNHYIGFEISGKIHLGTGLFSMSKVKDFMDSEINTSIFLADWHSWINDKLGGNLERIKKVAVGYFKEGMKASFKCIGGDPKKLKFVLGSDLYHNNDDYWTTLMEISKNTTLGRIKRSITIMGRREGETVDFAKLLYPPMQVADIFIQNIHIAHAGLDQRKAHVIARAVALKLKTSPLLSFDKKKIKPVAVHHPLLLGLGKPPVWPIPTDKLRDVWTSLKMSKSKPDTCLFIHDSPDEIRRKIGNAFCPEGEITFNPILDWASNLIFTERKSKLLVKRDKRYGGDRTFECFEYIEEEFKKKNLHPVDLKNAVAEKIIDILEPARKHFEKEENKKMLMELEEMINKK